jgi:uncharacterized membrane-anchored protein
MIEKRSWLWPLLIFVALMQSAALFKIVYDRDQLLKSGHEVIIPTRPVDPRDVFRGDYVTLGYDISSLRKSILPADVGFDAFQKGGTAYVTLRPDGAGGWSVAGLAPDYPAELKTGDVVLKARVRSVWHPENASDAQLNLRYGIESYFVPEGTGRAIEAKVRERKIEAIVAVDAAGTAALKGLVIDGERHVDPPLL